MNNSRHSPLSRWCKFLTPLPGFILLVWLLRGLDYAELGRVLAGAHWRPLAAGLLLFIPVIIGKTLRWQMLLNGFQIRLPFMETARLTLHGFSWGMVTPGQFGDFIRLWHLWKAGYSPGDGFSSLLADRFIDLLVFAGFAGGGLLYYFHYMSTSDIVLTATVLFSAICLTGAFFDYIFRNEKSLAARGIKFMVRHLPPRMRIGAGAGIRRIKLSRRQWLILTGVIIVEKFLLFVRLYMLALSVDIRIGVVVFVLTFSLVTIIQIIPLTIEGVGFREAAMVFFLGILGYSMEQAVALSVIFLVVRAVNALPGFFLGWRPPSEDLNRLNARLEETSQ